MFRVLIVDDEQIVLESVKAIINEQFSDIILETARNTREALIKMELFRPQVIMTDIRMPGMNGIEFIERARRFDQQVKIIIISAYDQFEFAKEAVKYNVEDYVLKPLTKVKLIEILDKTLEKIDTEAEKRNLELDHIERYYQSVDFVESNLFNSIVLNRNYMRQITHYRELLDIGLERGYFVCIEFKNVDFSASVEEVNLYNQKITECCENIKTQIKSEKNALVSNPFLNRIFIYIEKNELPIDLTYWQQLQQKTSEKFSIRARIGIGNLMPIERINESYESSILVLWQSDEAIVYKNDIEKSVDLEGFDKKSIEVYEDFYTKRKRFKQTLRNFEFEYMKLIKGQTTISHAEAGVIELLVRIHDICISANVMPKDRNADKQYLIEILNKTPVGKVQYFERIAKELFEIYCRTQYGAYKDITLAALGKMQKHFKEEITLESLAHMINVTPQYLSKIIKEDSGMTFKEYLTELRIEEAKKLLSKGQINIKDVGFDVGYNDTSYFIRTFKKYEGITPKDYQRMVKT